MTKIAFDQNVKQIQRCQQYVAGVNAAYAQIFRERDFANSYICSRGALLWILGHVEPEDTAVLVNANCLVAVKAGQALIKHDEACYDWFGYDFARAHADLNWMLVTLWRYGMIHIVWRIDGLTVIEVVPPDDVEDHSIAAGEWLETWEAKCKRGKAADISDARDILVALKKDGVL